VVLIQDSARMEGTNQKSPSELVPLRRAMQRAMADQELTFRQLAALTKTRGAREGKGFTHAHLNGIARGDEYPSVNAIKAIAGALGLEVEDIAEYQLARAREQIDERIQGLDAALENYARWVARAPGRPGWASPADVVVEGGSRRQADVIIDGGNTHRVDVVILDEAHRTGRIIETEFPPGRPDEREPLETVRSALSSEGFDVDITTVAFKTPNQSLEAALAAALRPARESRERNQERRQPQTGETPPTPAQAQGRGTRRQGRRPSSS
jgi:transcriptional regulator with XRE-family HTH domain